MTQFSRWKTYKVTPGPNTRSKDGITLIDDRQKEILIETTLEKNYLTGAAAAPPGEDIKVPLRPSRCLKSEIRPNQWTRFTQNWGFSWNFWKGGQSV